MEVVSRLVIDVCESGGRIRLDDLTRGRDAAVDVESAAWRRPFSVTRDLRSQLWVELNVDGLKLCASHWTKEGCTDRCGSLHLCKFFLLSTCSRHGCKFGHDVTSPHNAHVLSRHGLDSASPDAVKAIIKLKRTAETLPAACKFYNYEGGCDNSTEGSSACPYLHVCRHFLTGDCKFGPKCKRSHDLVRSGHARSILREHGITGDSNDELLRGLQPFQGEKTATLQAAHSGSRSSRSRSSSGGSAVSSIGYSMEPTRPPRRSLPFAETSPRAANPISPTATASTSATRDRPPEICSFNLVGKCNYGLKCRNHHSKLPYQWQQEEDDGQWKDCQSPLNVALEERFCKPSTATAKLLDSQVDILAMTLTALGRSRRLRRLETVSTAVSETRPFATEWQWYWLDNNDKWILYGQQGSSGVKSNTDSSSIEKSYQDFMDGRGAQELKFETDSFRYTLDFKQFLQMNLKTKIQRPVFRRPSIFITEATFEEMKRQRRRPGASFSLPVEWLAAPRGSDERYQLVEVRKGTPEHLKVAQPFTDSLTGVTVEKIERIQNPDLWEEYSRMKEKMKVKRSGKAVGEMLLFHGTGDDKIDAICQQGFDPRVAGLSSGTSFGRGSYFSTSSGYSEKYSRTSNKMIMALVLVGEYVNGKSDYTRPPPRNPLDPFGELYDSVVNDCNSPSIYVVFDSRQVYPNYIIHYNSMLTHLRI